MSYWAIILLAALVHATVAMPQYGYRYYIPQQYAMQRQYYPSFAQVVATRAAAPAAVPVPPPGGAAGGAGGLAIVPALPHTGLTGFGDNLGAGIANFGNGQGAALDALISGSLNAAGVLISGILGSGAVNTAFANFNNKPPQGYVLTVLDTLMAHLNNAFILFLITERKCQHRT